MVNGTKRISFELVGRTPILMHADDIMKNDTLQEWRKLPANKTISVPGDDRSPAWTWLTYAYLDEKGKFAMPSSNIMVCLRQAGAQMILKRQTTYKAITQSGMFIDAEFCKFEMQHNGKWTQVDVAPFEAIKDERFPVHMQAAKKAGFSLFPKRAKVGTSKHIRVRPKFDQWRITGEMELMVPEITSEVAEQLFRIAGSRVGLGDWRPGCPTPGHHGLFHATVKAI
jgi:hypothetical protein